MKNKAHMTGQTAPSGDFPATAGRWRGSAGRGRSAKRNPRRSEDLFLNTYCIYNLKLYVNETLLLAETHNNSSSCREDVC